MFKFISHISYEKEQEYLQKLLEETMLEVGDVEIESDDEEDDIEVDHLEERLDNSGSEQEISDTEQELSEPLLDGPFFIVHQNRDPPPLNLSPNLTPFINFWQHVVDIRSYRVASDIAARPHISVISVHYGTNRGQHTLLIRLGTQLVVTTPLNHKMENIDHCNVNTSSQNDRCTDDEGTIFKQKPRLTRSPPYKPNVSISLPELNDPAEPETDYDAEISCKTPHKDTLEGRQIKKRRRDSPIQVTPLHWDMKEYSQKTINASQIINDIILTSKKILKICEESQTTKKELKQAALSLQHKSGKLNSIQDLLQDMNRELNMHHTKTKEIATQTLSRKDQEEENRILQITATLAQNPSDEDFIKLLDNKWPEKFFTKTLKTGKVNTDRQDQDYLVFYNRTQPSTDPRCERILRKIPGLKERLMNLNAANSNPLTGAIAAYIRDDDDDTDGLFQITVGDDIRIDRSTVSRIMSKVLPLIARLKDDYIKMPSGAAAIAQASLEFQQIAEFPIISTYLITMEQIGQGFYLLSTTSFHNQNILLFYERTY
ncbi:hypothetical protein FQR65_LT16542 [Abscondita terminalis]|nr:hypothetical protein FQR65_LT16542 [Abscondita terminalis]